MEQRKRLNVNVDENKIMVDGRERVASQVEVEIKGEIIKGGNEQEFG